MIISVDSALPTFKKVEFKVGLNVLLSTKSSRSDDKKTRNSAGKSSLVEIVRFLLGGKAEKGSLARNPALDQHAFIGVFRIRGSEVRVTRTGANASRIFLESDDLAALGIKARKDKESGLDFVSNEEWKDFLGSAFFGLPAEPKGTEFGDPFTPTFPSMLAYFARNHGSGAFHEPTKQSNAQQPWDSQVNLSYLLGLDWRVPRDLLLLKQKEKRLAERKKEAKEAGEGPAEGTVAALRHALVSAEDAARRLRERTALFHVHEAYVETMEAATLARSQMLEIARRTVPAKETIAYLRSAIEREKAPAKAEVDRLYAAVGIELPGVARRRLDEVEAFHASVVENRRARLEGEIAAVERAVAADEATMAKLDAERGSLLRALEGRGALEDFVDMQARLATAEATAAILRERYAAVEDIETQETACRIERGNIKLRLQEDHQRHKDRIDGAILLVDRAIRALYEDRTGRFEVEATDRGPEFRISIQGDRGGGISSMEIFCLDIALFALWCGRQAGPDFLVHDSHLFDGVDFRQVARAMEVGEETSRKVGGQYIVTMNSDVFDALPLRLAREDVVLGTRLSDADETSGLFGCRFD